MNLEISLRPIAEVPPHVAQPHREYNLLQYGPSSIFGAYNENAQLVGVIRYAQRIKSNLVHGILADLHLDDTLTADEAKKVAAELIKGAEQALRALDCTKIDAVVIDGSRLAQHFIDAGYWASRKMVTIEWDLNTVKIPTPLPDVTLSLETQLNTNEVTDFILASYQPYWRWWKNDAFDRLWDRVDYPDYTPDKVDEENAEHNREHVQNMLEDGFAEGLTGEHIFAVGRKNGKIIGMCDAKLVDDPLDDYSDWGVLMLKDHPGKGFGQLLLFSCLNWLKQKGKKTATITTTSGLDDFDPTVYLYVQSCGGKIKGEFNNFVKRKF